MKPAKVEPITRIHQIISYQNGHPDYIHPSLVLRVCLVGFRKKDYMLFIVNVYFYINVLILIILIIEDRYENNNASISGTPTTLY